MQKATLTQRLMHASIKTKAIIAACIIAVTSIVGIVTERNRQKPEYPQAMLTADRMASENPDSAALLLKRMEADMANAPEAVRMRYQLIQQKLKAYTFGTYRSDSTALALVKYYETRGERELLPQAYYYAGKAYMSLNDSPMAMEYFYKSLDIIPESDLNLRSRIYSQLGYIFDRQWLDNDALEMFNKAYQCDSMTNDTVSMIFSLRDMGGIFADIAKPDSALVCYNKALSLAEASKDKPMAITVTGQLARFYSQQGDYEKAFKYLKEIINEDSCWDRSSIAGIAAKWYEASGKRDSAIMYYKEVAEIGTVYTKANAYRVLSDCALAQNDLKAARRNLEKYKKLIDSIQAITATETINQKHDLYEYRFREREINRLQQKSKEQNTIIAILASTCAMAVLAFIFSITYVRQKQNAQQQKLEKIQTAKAAGLETESQSASKEEMMRSEEIYKSIMLMVNNPNTKKKITEEMWAALSQAINKIYPGFDEKLYGLCKMSTFDYHICLLIKIRLSPSSIAAIANLSTSGVSTLRSKLFMRAFNRKGRPSDWDDVIASL